MSQINHPVYNTLRPDNCTCDREIGRVLSVKESDGGIIATVCVSDPEIIMQIYDRDAVKNLKGYIELPLDLNLFNQEDE